MSMRFNIHDGRYRSLIIFLLCIVSQWGSQSARGDSKAVTIRVAAVSFVPKKFDLPGNADKLARLFRLAKQGGAKIAVAPEGALDGYVVNEIIAGLVAKQKMNEVAIPIDHKTIRRFQTLAQQLKLCLVFGFAEQIDNNVFNCAVFIDDTGKICGKYHKMQFAEGYDPSWWFNRLGRRSRAFDTPYGRCGIMICNDRWNPVLAQIPVLDGAQFLLIPAFGSRSKSQDEAVLSRGRENNVPIVEANVGVSLIVNENKIVAVDRQWEGITFAEITIPPQSAAKPIKRDEVERQFLEWREQEMQRRLKLRQQRLGEKEGKREQ
jgi:predicted amidohydrolase